ncbi:MAG: hypothetical protein ABI590_08095, partial [Ilumatobacteraceae bacterium]
MINFTIVINVAEASRSDLKRTLKSLRGTIQSPLALVIVGSDSDHTSVLNPKRLLARHVQIT